MKHINKYAFFSIMAIFSLAVVQAPPVVAEDGAKTGIIKGKIEISGDKVKTKGATSQKDFVVYIKEVKDAKFEAPEEPIVVKQIKLNFTPHVATMVKGSKVSFENVDTVKHNVYAEEEHCKIDQDTDKGAKMKHTFDKAGVFPIVCRLHPEMSFYAVVLDNPYYDHAELSRVKGKRYTYESSFEIKGLPPGKYVLKTWNKKVESQEFEVTCVAGETVEKNISIKLKK